MLTYIVAVLVMLSACTAKASVDAEIGGQNAFMGVQTEGDGTLSTSTVKKLVMDEFGPSSHMVDIARCESYYRQYDSDGEVLRGKVDDDDIGIFQINQRYHIDKSEKLGYDIYTVEGNIRFARYLYDRYGLLPWRASEECWAG